MKCAVHMHDPCKGPVHVELLCGTHEVPLCYRHGRAWRKRQRCPGRRVAIPFRWQTDEQLERWARDAAEKAKRRGVA